MGNYLRSIELNIALLTLSNWPINQAVLISWMFRKFQLSSQENGQWHNNFTWLNRKGYDFLSSRIIYIISSPFVEICALSLRKIVWARTPAPVGVLAHKRFEYRSILRSIQHSVVINLQKKALLLLCFDVSKLLNKAPFWVILVAKVYLYYYLILIPSCELSFTLLISNSHVRKIVPDS